MTGFDLFEDKWIGLFDKLQGDSDFVGQTAAPFLSVPVTESRSILYVGKATAGDWDWEPGDFLKIPKVRLNDRIEDRRELTRRFLREWAEAKYNSGFWHFARKLNDVAADKWKVPVRSSLQHIIWTNICKIGARKGNPRSLLLAKQRDLSVETLRAEIRSYKPDLVCFVTWDFGWDLVKEVFGDTSDGAWDKTRNEDWIWQRPARNGTPLAVLLRHPQGKRRQLREKWLNLVSEILPH